MQISEIISNRINDLNELASILGITPFGAGVFLKGEGNVNLKTLEKVFDNLGIECVIKGEKKKIEYEVSTEINKNTFRYYCEYWLRIKKLEVKESTYGTYASQILYNILPYLGDVELDKLNPKLFQALIYKLCEEGKKPKSARDTITLLKQIVRMGQEEGIINEFIFPRFKYPKDNTIKEKKAYSKNEIAKIVSKCFEEIENRSDERYCCLAILLAIFSGMRIGEICALQFKDIDLEKKLIYVRKTLERIVTPLEKKRSKIVIQTPKTSDSIRDIPIQDKMLEIIKKLKIFDDDYVASGRKKYYEPRTLREHYVKLVKSLGIEPIKFHGLRHTFASINIENGTDTKTISELLGHSGVEITLDIYTHISNETKANAINNYTTMLASEENGK